MDGQPKLLTLDVETAPGIAYIWNLFDDFVPLERLIEPGRILCWAAQWIGSKEVMYADERKGPAKMHKAIHALLSEADAVVTFNGDRFDLPRLNGAFVEHRLPALPPLASIDLYKTVKKLGLMSGKLEYVGPFLKIGAKVKHEGFSLWKQVLAGNRQAWDRMKKYNCQDVRLTSRLYEYLKPYIKNHPRLHPKAKDRPACRVCDSSHVTLRGSCFTKEARWSRIQCQDCGTWDKAKQKAAPREERE
jgi:hypothetical protein